MSVPVGGGRGRICNKKTRREYLNSRSCDLSILLLPLLLFSFFLTFLFLSVYLSLSLSFFLYWIVSRTMYDSIIDLARMLLDYLSFINEYHLIYQLCITSYTNISHRSLASLRSLTCCFVRDVQCNVLYNLLIFLFQKDGTCRRS